MCLRICYTVLWVRFQVGRVFENGDCAIVYYFQELYNENDRCFHNVNLWKEKSFPSFLAQQNRIISAAVDPGGERITYACRLTRRYCLCAKSTVHRTACYLSYSTCDIFSTSMVVVLPCQISSLSAHVESVRRRTQQHVVSWLVVTLARWL